MHTTLPPGPTNVERWTHAFNQALARWPKVEKARAGIGDAFLSRDKLFAETQSTMRTLQVKVRLPKTHQQRAISLGVASNSTNHQAHHAGWVEVEVDSDARLQDALTLARQAYMETQR